MDGLTVRIFKDDIETSGGVGGEGVDIQKNEERTKIRILRWTLAISLKEHLDRELRRAAVVKGISKVRRGRLRWDGHVTGS